MTPRRLLPLLFASCTALLVVPALNAQQAPAGLLNNTVGYSPVAFTQPALEELGAMTPLANRVFKPQGDGPFPAVVLVHTCGGVDAPHIRTHARALLEAGFAVLVQDSHGPRGLRTCREKPVPFAVGVMDAYAGLNHLGLLPFVRKDDIHLVGYSYGGSVAALAASRQSADLFRSPLRFRSSVAHYITCITSRGSTVVGRDVDRPLLVLLGGKDEETPPASCFPYLDELRQAGAPIRWHLYPNASHGWDKQGEGRNGYVYDAEITRDATRRMIEFLRRDG